VSLKLYTTHIQKFRKIISQTAKTLLGCYDDGSFNFIHYCFKFFKDNVLLLIMKNKRTFTYFFFKKVFNGTTRPLSLLTLILFLFNPVLGLLLKVVYLLHTRLNLLLLP
jgi:hypothetical protein